MEPKDLHKAGLKATTPRLRILEILQEGGPQHLSAEDIYRRLADAGEDVGLATVYRVLTQFEDAKIVTRHRFEGGHSVYELNAGAHHDHILCLKCGRVDEFVDAEIEKRQRKIAADAGYEMTDHALYLYGVCAACRRAAGAR